MTVSFVLNNKPGQVSDDTRERVLRTVREMNYRPRAAAPSRRETAMHTLGVASGVNSDSLTESGYFSAVMNGILHATERIGANVLLFHRDLFHTDTHQSIRTYFDGRSEGLLVIAPNRGSALVSGLFERGVPFVLIGAQSENPSVSCVDIDNEAVAAAALNHLTRLGHTRIGFIGGADFVESATTRRAAFRRQMQERGLYDERRDVADAERGNAYALTLSLLRLPDDVRPTALLCWNDGAAARSLMAVQDAHLQCPRDISLVGVDDDMASFRIHPSLTTIRQPYREIGERAVEALMARIRAPFAEAIRAFVPPQLVIRESSGPPPVVLRPVSGVLRP